MFGLDSVDSVAHVIQVALTPVFLLSGIASLLGVLSTRLGRVADRVDSLAERLEAAEPAERSTLQTRLTYLQRRSHVLDAAVMMGTECWNNAASTNDEKKSFQCDVTMAMSSRVMAKLSATHM